MVHAAACRTPGQRGVRPPPDGARLKLVAEQGAGRWAILALLTTALLGAMSQWFSATAVAAELASRLGVGSGDVTGLTTAVQWGFVAGTAMAALLNLADTVPSRLLFAVSAAGVAAANAALLTADSYTGAVAYRFATGAFMAGVYPPAMKMVSTWFGRSRGLAIGAVVGALAVGKALPYLLKGRAAYGVQEVLSVTSGAALVAGLAVAVLYRTGPFPFAGRPFSWRRVLEVLRHGPTLLATGGYVGHMWELYTVWALGPVFLASATGMGDVAGFFLIGVGGVGAVVAGFAADRRGRIPVASWSLIISGGCCVAMGWTVGMNPWIPGALGLVWGVFVVSDSAQFSALVTEVAPSHAVGTALTLQTMLGFAVTGISIPLTTWIQSSFGWGVAFTSLVVGPAAGLLSMRLLARRLTTH